MPEKDEAPETVEEATDKTADAVKDAQEVAEKPEPEPKHTAEDIPEWGKQLRSDLDSLAEQVSKPVDEGAGEVPGMPEHGEEIEDATPVRRPWHKRWLGE